MEDLYNNLENYNEVNALAELKFENKELKMKLQEYASKMEKLQKDFDTLSSGFKKLEHNYSSLLKTAKSEIEKKTKTITDLNIEKDMLVLSALKEGNKSVLHLKKHMPAFKKNKLNVIGGAVNRELGKDVKDEQNKKIELANKSLEDHQTSSNDKVNVAVKEKLYKQNTVKKIEPNNSCGQGNSHTKENVENNVNIVSRNQNGYPVQTVEYKSMNIKNRRKSIPVLGVECENFPSEKGDCFKIDGSQKDGHLREKEDRKTFFKFDERHSSKSSETSNWDERVSGYHEPARDLYKGRRYKNFSTDKHRSRDKYENSQRYKKYSPERYKRHSRDYYEDNNYRPDFSKSKIRESPPLDRFHHYSYKEHRTDYDRFHFNDHERYPQSRERNSGKHKMSHEYEEPYTKKPKTDYYGRRKEDVRWNGDEIEEHQELTETFEKLQKQYISCQSPDYIYDEIDPEPIKVIMDTAETSLEDPRVKSNKYILSNDNGLVSLSTINGRHVDLVPVNTINWQLQTVSMPNALRHLPLENQMVKDLYMDICEPPNFNKESNNTGSQYVLNKHLVENKEHENTNHEDILGKTSVATKAKDTVGIPTQGCLSGHKMQKIKKIKPETKINTFMKESPLQVIENLCLLGNNDQQIASNYSNPQKLANSEKHDNLSISDDNKTSTVFQNSVNVSDNQRVLSTREIVEGDLELSDETCDNIELQKTINHAISEEKVNSSHKNNVTCHTNLEDAPTISTIEVYQLDHSPTNKVLNCSINDRGKALPIKVDNMLTGEKHCDHTELGKKLKNKQKIQKHKESEYAEVIAKKCKSKKEKKSKSLEVKPKFNDLFGDSNSLITPDDLGISTSQVQPPPQIADIYVPIFEDAQDATDLGESTNAQSLLTTNTDKDNKENFESNLNQIEDINKVVPEETNCNIKAANDSETIVNTIQNNLPIDHVDNRSDIVKTIVISSGIQATDNNTEPRVELLMNAKELVSEDSQPNHPEVTHKIEDVLIKALATSTPHKVAMNQVAHEIDSKLPESCLSPDNVLINAPTHIPQRCNTLEAPNEDLPDVRIFVKRRRRIIKNTK